MLTRCHLPLPTSSLTDEKHSRCLTERVYLTSIVRGRVIWPLGSSASKSAAACTASYGVFQHAALAHEPSYQGRGGLTDGFDSTVSSMRTLFPTARLGLCLRHALNKLPRKLLGLSAPIRKGFRSTLHALRHRCRQRKSRRLVALGQRLRHCANRIAKAVGEAHGERVRHGFEDKKAGWYAGLADPQMPAMRTGVEQAHNAIARKLFARKGCHHPGGSQGACLTGLAHLYHRIPSQRRALNAGQWGVAIEGGRVPTSAWVLNLPIRASGGYRPARRDATTSFGGVWVGLAGYSSVADAGRRRCCLATLVRCFSARRRASAAAGGRVGIRRLGTYSARCSKSVKRSTTSARLRC